MLRRWLGLNAFPLQLILLALFCAIAGAVRGATSISIDVGWEGMYRVGSWTPVFITAADDKANPARNILLSITTPHDNAFTTRIVQRFAVSRTPTTHLLYVPLGFRLDEVNAVIRDGNSGRFITERNFDPNYDPRNAPFSGIAPSNPGEILLGVSGRRKTMDILQGNFELIERDADVPDPNQARSQPPSIRTGFLPPSRLPDVSLGYEGLSALVLNGPDLTQLDAARQQAIAEWVRGGGSLLLWPSPLPIPPDSPIASLLPAAFGETTSVELALEETRRLGLLPRQEKVTGRRTIPNAGAKSVSFLEGKATAVFGRVGLGRVAVLSIDASQLLFKDEKVAQTLWRPILRELLVPEMPDPRNSYYYETPADARRRAATVNVINVLGDVPGIGTFDFSYIAIVLIALMFIVGPVDWFVLKRLGKQPWTWATVAGWVVLITIGALYIGHAFRSGDLHYRTLRVIDQDGTTVVGAIDVVGIYSPRTAQYALETPHASWWKPADVEMRFPHNRSRPPTEIAHDQDERGNRPRPMTINVWNLRFLSGESSEPSTQRALIEAKLTSRKDERNKEHVSGTIRNLSQLTLRHIRVQTKRGLASIEGELAPGQSRDIDAAVVAGDNSLAAPHEVQPNSSYNAYQIYERTTPEAAFMRAACDLPITRALRMEELLARQDGIACVYAQAEDVPAAIKMTYEGTDPAKEKHWQVVRALVTLGEP